MRIHPLIFLLLGLYAVTDAQGRTFVAEGSDSGAGVGARYIALGGAGAAISNDVYAAYSNPAGLAELEGVEIAASRQLNAILQLVSFAGMAARLPLDASWGFKATMAGVYYPRMHARASGAFRDNEVESIFLRYLLPGLPGTFDGEIDSKTKVYRIALGLGPANSDVWSIGFNVDKIDCRTNYCGVHATSNGYTTASGGATATSYGAGFKYRPLPALTLAGAVSDVSTRLNVDVTTTDDAGTRINTYRILFPMKMLFGAAYRFSSSLQATGDYEIFRGTYGNNDIDWRFLRMGAEVAHSEAFMSRFGAIVPVVIRSSRIKEGSLPFPFSPTIGLGYRQKHFRADVAVYAHSLMSLHQGGVSPAADLSITLNF
ncbi:MAG: hypothetical protein EPO42_12265 [Gallionellaceae bacterium]|nr:MAG: hypothetical protein EPO42_12265 [Gallionellaceae bacterium]